MKRFNVGLIGFGTVGVGVVRAFQEKSSFLQKKTGIEIFIKKICDKDITSPRAIKVRKEILTTNVNKILKDPEIDIVVELIGGVHPAKEYIKKSLKAGKHVVTANKALLAQSGEEIFRTASESNTEIRFEASVGGGIPIVKVLREGLISNRIEILFGIINGTSNYVLSQMSEVGCSFKDALLEAKRRGYAERNPSVDIEGIDSAHKLVILCLLSFGGIVKLEDIYVEGIQNISLSDVIYAKELGYVIKLLAIAKRVGRELEVRVHPTLLPKGHLLSSISGVYNAIYVYGDMVGETIFYGQGAGQRPTASAVIGDIVDLACDITDGIKHTSLSKTYAFMIENIRKMEETQTRYYIRFQAIDRPGVLAKISGILGRNDISIATVAQKEKRRANIVPIVMMTHEAKESNIRRAIKLINQLDVIRQKSVVIRMESG